MNQTTGMLEVRDPADLRSVVGKTLAGSPFKEQGAPGLRFYTRIKTTAVRYAW